LLEDEFPGELEIVCDFKLLPFFYGAILKIKHHDLLNVECTELVKVLFSHFTMISHAQTGVGTPSTTGWFEVEVNGKLVHSKKVRVDPLSLLYCISFTIMTPAFILFLT